MNRLKEITPISRKMRLKAVGRIWRQRIYGRNQSSGGTVTVCSFPVLLVTCSFWILSIEHQLILLFHPPSSKYGCDPGHQVSKSIYSSVWGDQGLGSSWHIYWSMTLPFIGISQHQSASASYDVCDPESKNSQSGYKLFLSIGLKNLVLLQYALYRIILSCAWSQKRPVLSMQSLSVHSHSKVISSIKSAYTD